MEGHQTHQQSRSALLWPNSESMSTLTTFTRPYNTLIIADTPAPVDLLWPAQLINTQAKLQKRKDWSRLPAAIAFCLSLILGFAMGPVQLILIAVILDYSWVTTVYYPRALHYILPLSCIVAILSLVSIVLSWHSQPKHTRITAILIGGTLLELGLIWLSGCITPLAPHTFTLIFILIAVITIMSALLLNKQPTVQRYNSSITHAILITMAAFAICNIACSGYYLLHDSKTNPVQLELTAAAQAQARIDGVPELLSNLAYTLCDGPYQLIYLGKERNNGLFECSASHEVYSVEDPAQATPNAVRGYATYLGTTYNQDLSVTFPNTYYLYRSIPQSLNEDELVLMYPASSERELVDNIASPLLDYWNAHNQRNLYINIFYALTLDTMQSTKDYILMAAVGTMAKASHLPHEDIIYGYHDGAMVNYIFQPDDQLRSLNELGADPALYSAHTRDSLKTFRHISLHLPADTTYDLDTFKEMLNNSFTGGLE